MNAETAANTTLAINIMLNLLAQAQKISAIISTARAEGRDVTAAEIDTAAAADDAARDALDKAINEVQR